MSFIWNWWSGGKKEEEKKEEEKEKEEEQENEEKEEDEEKEEKDDKEKEVKENKENNEKSKINLTEEEKGKKENKLNKKTQIKKINRPDLSINKDDPLHWNSVVYGPENSPYNKGKFEILINFEKNKPDKKPTIQFKTKIYHYNIKQNNGELLCPSLWSKYSSEKENLKKIKLIMASPDPRYPCSYFVQEEYYNDFQKYKEKAMKFTEDYAMN